MMNPPGSPEQGGQTQGPPMVWVLTLGVTGVEGHQPHLCHMALQDLCSSQSFRRCNNMSRSSHRLVVV